MSVHQSGLGRHQTDQWSTSSYCKLYICPWKFDYQEKQETKCGCKIKCNSRIQVVICIFHMGNLITWRSNKQNIVAKPDATVEYKTITNGACEVSRVKTLITDLEIPSSFLCYYTVG